MKKYVILILALFGLVYVYRGPLEKVFVKEWVKMRFGLDSTIKDVQCDFRKKTVTLTDMKVNNPFMFKEKEMVAFKEIVFTFDTKEWRSALTGKFIIKELDLSISRLAVVRNEDKDINIILLLPSMDGEYKPGLIRCSYKKAVLTMDQFIYTDHSSAGKAGISRAMRFEDVSRLQSMTELNDFFGVYKFVMSVVLDRAGKLLGNDKNLIVSALEDYAA